MDAPPLWNGACEDASTSGRDRYAWVPYPVGHRKRDGFIANYETTVAERDAFYSRTTWTPAVAKALASEAFRPDRDRAMTLRYDQSEYPLLDAFCDLVGERHLSTVHERWSSHDRSKSHLEEKRALLAPLAVPSEKRDAFEDVYDRLVREVVLPAIAKRQGSQFARSVRRACRTNDDVDASRAGATADATDDVAAHSGVRYLYAAFPCARVQQPSSLHTIRCHVDSMYGHGPCSVNCWLPLTKLDARGTNSLHVESAPGKEDFQPIRVDVGEIRVFDGSACAHYTVANACDETRVSLDFRVVSEALFVYDDAERTTASLKEKNVKVGNKTRYRLGGYFSAAQADAFGAFRRVARGAPCVKHGFPHSDEEKGA
jgi:hypothetical protein